MIWNKTDLINHLADVRGARAYLEICTAGTGGRYADINRALFEVCHRLMYDCPASFDDGLAVDFRSASFDISEALAEIARRGQRYDVILVDGFHRYDLTERDFIAALDLLADGGTIVAHDCLPSDESLITAELVPGAWCGASYRTYVDLIHARTDISAYTVDIDFGCGIVRKVVRPTPAEIARAARVRPLVESWRALGDDTSATFRYLHEHKVDLLNLVSLEDFVLRESTPPKRLATSITLAMIVKNEAHVIARCLASVRPLLSHWVVVDTGSTDGTQDVIRRVMQDVPGEVYDRPWRGFGASRTEAFDLARGTADYALVIDADDVLDLGGGFELPALDRDAYALEVHLGDLHYARPQLFRLDKPWRYVGVIHEYAHCDEPTTRGTLEGIIYVCGRDGARSKDPAKYRHDAELLDLGMKDEPENARYVFYGAQSWRDAGEDARALALYEKRATMGGFAEEVFIAKLEAAKARARLGESRAVVIAAHLDAHASRPSRGEALYELARYLRVENELALAWIFADAAVRIPFPHADTLFVPADVYGWRIHDELALAAYWTGRYEIARETNERLVNDRRVPGREIARIADNLAWAIRKLKERKS